MNIAHAAALAAAIEALSTGHAQVLASQLRAVLESDSSVAAEPQTSGAPHAEVVVNHAPARGPEEAGIDRRNADRCKRYRARKRSATCSPLQTDMFSMSAEHVATRSPPPDLDHLAVGERVSLHVWTPLDDILRVAAKELPDDVVERSWRRFKAEHYGETFNRKRLMGAWMYWLTMERPEVSEPDRCAQKPSPPVRAAPRGMSPPVLAELGERAPLSEVRPLLAAAGLG